MVMAGRRLAVLIVVGALIGGCGAAIGTSTRPNGVALTLGNRLSDRLLRSAHHAST
jgi:hypothetical protein